MIIRPIRAPAEFEALKRLDAGFTSARIFHITREGHRFTLADKAALPPLMKCYSLANLANQVLPTDHTLVAEDAGVLVGVASMRFEAWNKRAMLRHLYISAAHRRRGAGRALVEAVATRAIAAHARCLWVETQNTNHPAVEFYLRLGFHLCGFDTSLYTMSTHPSAEIGLFFAKAL